MKVYINNNTEQILNVDSIVERNRQGESVLDLSFNDASSNLFDDLNKVFSDIQTVTIVRTDLNGEEKTIVYSQYTELNKVQRRITDEVDIITVTLSQPVVDENETEG